MSNIEYHKDQMNQAKNQVEYLNRRIRGVHAALDTATNTAVVKALRTELNNLQAGLRAQQRCISDNEQHIKTVAIVAITITDPPPGHATKVTPPGCIEIWYWECCDQFAHAYTRVDLVDQIKEHWIDQ